MLTLFISHCKDVDVPDRKGTLCVFPPPKIMRFTIKIKFCLVPVDPKNAKKS